MKRAVDVTSPGAAGLVGLDAFFFLLYSLAVGGSTIR